MTRLTTDMLLTTENEVQAYASTVRELTGLEVCELAEKAAMLLYQPEFGATSVCHGILDDRISSYIENTVKEPHSSALRFEDPELRASRIAGVPCAIIPVTAGQGEISGFDVSVKALLNHLGADVKIVHGTDVSGLYDAISQGAEIIFMADDDRFIAMNVRCGYCCDNDIATAAGYTAALEHMFQDFLIAENVAVLGFGRIGRFAATMLSIKFANVFVFDKDSALLSMASDAGYQQIMSQDEIADFSLIFDATNEGGWLKSDNIAQNAIIAAPGIPLSFDFDIAAERPDVKVFHDTLFTGTAVMLYAVLPTACCISHA